MKASWLLTLADALRNALRINNSWRHHQFEDSCRYQQRVNKGASFATEESYVERSNDVLANPFHPFYSETTLRFKMSHFHTTGIHRRNGDTRSCSFLENRLSVITEKKLLADRMLRKPAAFTWPQRHECVEISGPVVIPSSSRLAHIAIAPLQMII